jgi:TetR/AcrR family transcriptional repressor of nem operon
MPWQKSFNVEDTLERAMHTFWVRGYEATSVQDLVGCTGINRGSLYATYGGKRELFLAALRHYDETIRRRFTSRLERRFGPREAIRRQFQAAVDSVVVQKRNWGCFITNTALELAAHDTTVAAIVANAQTEMEEFFARSIAKGQAAGEISAGISPHKTAQGLLASYLGLRVLSRSRPDHVLLQTIADEAQKCLQ